MAAGAGFEPWADRLHFLVWANSYDAQAAGEPVWWWARKAVRLGATEAARRARRRRAARRHGRRGSTAGPGRRSPCRSTGAAVVHRETVELGLAHAAAGAGRAARPTLAPDQLASVGHGAGPARIVAPAGSGKTRVLTERLRHLLADRGYEREAVLALAYNKKAQEEMAVPPARPRRPDPDAQRVGLRPPQPRAGPPARAARRARGAVDRRAPRADAAAAGEHRPDRARTSTASRSSASGCADPRRSRPTLDDVPGLAAAYGPYRGRAAPPGRDRLRRAGLRRGRGAAARRRAAPSRAGRPPPPPRRRAPGPHARPRAPRPPGVRPRLRRVRRGRRRPVASTATSALTRGSSSTTPLLPGRRAARARGELPLPGAGHRGGRARCSYNDRRVPEGDPARARTSATDAERPRGAAPTPPTPAPPRSSRPCTGWLAEPERRHRATSPCSPACSRCCWRPHVALAEAGVPVDSILDESVLVAPRRARRARLPAHRRRPRPRRRAATSARCTAARAAGLPQWATKFLDRCRSVDDVRQAAARIDDVKVAAKLDDLAIDLDRLAGLARRGAIEPRPAHSPCATTSASARP